MQLLEFTVEGLFGKYNHQVRFPTSDEEDSTPSITILHGGNGIGKTTVLRMLACMMQFKLDYFGQVPFESCKLSFDNRRRLLIRRIKGEGISLTFNGLDATYRFRDGEGASQQDPKFDELKRVFSKNTEGISWSFLPADRTRFLVSDPDFSLLDEDNRYLRANAYYRELERERVREREFSNVLALRVRNFIREALVDHRGFFATGDPEVFTRVIQNLRNIQEVPPSREEIARELTFVAEQERVQKRFGFPVESWDYKELMAALNEAREEKPNEHVLVAVKTYAEFLASKAGVRQLVADRLITFEEVMKEFLADKDVRIDARRGITITDSTGVQLRETQLSSGEYQLLYLMVAALTTRRRGTVIAIDEPELSMHIGWQRKLVQNLLRCASRAALQLIIATHSPDIAADYPDSMIELS
ncbi:ATP-binding protein [Nonomuraea sp. NPDC023979]|uniref:ATP-binding protein n=1 Tax=Nonomuraea sp. NPDC023979 TaxID=3154796 RepID=UPI0033E031C2